MTWVRLMSCVKRQCSSIGTVQPSRGLLDIRMINNDCVTAMQRSGRKVDISGPSGVDD